MKQIDIEHAITKMQTSEFLQEDQLKILNEKTDVFIKEMNDAFGYNDGEPLEEDGLEFVMQLMRYKWMLVNGVCEE